ncbi:MAG: NADPH-dependent F420 reductase [Candidatus Kariarchaeaceae archaeon]|jgi:NADPH-dependent F420 reductase
MTSGTIGIIGGTGKQGSGLAKRWLKVGHDILIGSRSVEKGKKRAGEILKEVGENKGQISGGDNTFAAKADIVVLAIPADQVEPLVLPLSHLIENKVILDLTVNIKYGRYPKAEQFNGASVYEYIRELFPKSKVVSCLKTISAHSLASSEELNQIDFQMSMDDEAISIAHDLVQEIGLTPIRVRGKVHAFTIERMVALAIQINKEYPGSHVGYDLKHLVQLS